MSIDISKTAQIIQFAAARRPKLGKKIGTRSAPFPAPQCEGGVSDTAENFVFARSAMTSGGKLMR